MKIEQLLLLSIAVVFVKASPARSDCGVTKTLEAENPCGVKYGGTWVECANGVTEMPTFLMPSCSITAAEANITADPTLAAQEAAETPAITPAPIFTDPFAPNAANETGGCHPLWVCVDAIESCANYDTRYGSCYNTCTASGLTSTPSCSFAPQPTQAAEDDGRDHAPAEDDPPVREHKDFCDLEPFLCAPPGW